MSSWSDFAWYTSEEFIEMVVAGGMVEEVSISYSFAQMGVEVTFVGTF